MKKSRLTEEVEIIKTETQKALQIVIDELNKGQKQKIVKNTEIKELLDRYNVIY